MLLSLADEQGVPPVVPVAPDAPGNEPIVQAPPSGSGPAKTWEIPDDDD